MESDLRMEAERLVSDLESENEQENMTMWKCKFCGSMHRERGNHKFTLAVEIPPMEADGCGYSCPFLHSDDDGEYCCEGHGVEAGDDVKIKPGPGCPRWEETKWFRASNVNIAW